MSARLQNSIQNEKMSLLTWNYTTLLS